MFFRSIGWQELVLIIIVLLLIIGPKKLPEMARSLGTAIREFRSEQKSARDAGARATDARTADDVALKRDAEQGAERSDG